MPALSHVFVIILPLYFHFESRHSILSISDIAAQLNPDEDKPTEILQVAYTKVSELGVCKQYNSDVDENNICTDEEPKLCEFDTGNSPSDFP